MEGENIIYKKIVCEHNFWKKLNTKFKKHPNHFKYYHDYEVRKDKIHFTVLLRE